MRRDWTSGVALHHGTDHSKPVPDHVADHERLVSALRAADRHLTLPGGASLCPLREPSRGARTLCRFNCVSARNSGGAGRNPLLMDEDLHRKNKRIVIALLVFAFLLALLVIAWKLSIYQKT